MTQVLCFCLSRTHPRFSPDATLAFFLCITPASFLEEAFFFWFLTHQMLSHMFTLLLLLCVSLLFDFSHFFFLQSRNDWCISRQRTWGVPIPVFYNRDTNEPLLNKETLEHVRKLIAEKGSDVWWSSTEESNPSPPPTPP